MQWLYLKGNNIPVEASDFRHVDGICDVVEDEGVDVIIPGDKKNNAEARSKEQTLPFQNFKDSFLSGFEIAPEYTVFYLKAEF